MKGKYYVLMDDAGAGAGGGAGSGGDGGGAGSTAAPAAGAATGQPAASAPAVPAAAPSGNAPAGGAPAANPGAAPAATGKPESALQIGADAAQPFGIPEKYQVKKDDGSIDLEKSAAKLAEGARQLEKRMGTGDIPPKTADEYKITVPDALKDVWKPDEDPLFKEFKKEAHAKGFTQAQMDLAISTYMDIAPKLLQGDKALTAEECIADLKKTWANESEFKQNMTLAFKAASAYGDSDTQKIMSKYGNDPMIVRLLSRIGKELGEDRSLPAGPSIPGGVSVETLMLSEAYNNAKHPEHAKVSKQVSDYYARIAAQQEKAGNAPLI